MAEPNETALVEEKAAGVAKKSSLLRFVIPVLALLIPAGGGFYVTYSGMLHLPLGSDAKTAHQTNHAYDPAPVSFVPLDEMIISLGPTARARHLIFHAEIETVPEAVAEIEALRPRIMDLFNVYLRAVEENDLEQPSGMTKIRAQLLRRIKVVVGPAEVRDLLFTKFIMK